MRSFLLLVLLSLSLLLLLPSSSSLVLVLGADVTPVQITAGTAVQDSVAQGAFKYYEVGIPDGETKPLTFTVTPAAGVDVNLYAYRIALDAYDLPPHVPEAQDCVTSFDARGGANPGEPEALTVSAIDKAFHVVFVVAGPGGALSGAYTLHVTEVGGVHGPGG